MKRLWREFWTWVLYNRRTALPRAFFRRRGEHE